MIYLAESGAGIDEYRKSFIEAACGEPFSFFLVTGADPGNSLALRDLLLEREVTVKERQASALLKRGDILYGRTVSLAGQSILLGVAPVPLPPDMQGSLLDLRDKLKKSSKTKGRLDPSYIQSQDDVLRLFYFDAADRVMNPPPPVLQNTDGDPLMSIRFEYELHCTPEQAVERLQTLVLPEFRDKIMDGTEFDRSGRIARMSLTWQKRGNRMNPEWDNTSLGTIDIRPRALTVEVNSEKRAAKIRGEIQTRLGDLCVLVKEESQPADVLLAQAQSRVKAGKRQKGQAEDMQPEFREMLKEHMKAHWDAWLDKSILALKNQSPRQAARTPAGLERLEALLLQMERRNESVVQSELRADVPELRRQLGLKT